MTTLHVVRDVDWQHFFRIAQQTEPSNEYCIQMADSFWRIQKRCKQHKDLKFSQRPKILAMGEIRTDVVLICSATLMNGKICSSKATCGNYCKRHKLI